jgi:hypothetical protein
VAPAPTAENGASERGSCEPRCARHGARAWQRANAESVIGRLPADYVQAAFVLYRGNEDLVNLNGPISRLIHGADFYLPERAFVAWAVSERIMSQQMSWLDLLIDRREDFLGRYAGGEGDRTR